MTFAAALARAHATMFATFGDAEAAQYTTACGTLPVSVIVDYDLTRYGDRLSVASGSVVISFNAAEVAARPRRGETVTLASGRQFRLDAPVQSDGFVHAMSAAEVTA